MLQILRTRSFGEILSDAFDGMGDPAFYGSESGVLLLRTDIGDDEVLRDVVASNLDCTYVGRPRRRGDLVRVAFANF